MVGRPVCPVAPGGELVLRHDFIPHAERQEDVRRHVLRVGGIGRDSGVRPGGRQTQRRMGGVVVAVNQEVCGAGMVRVVPEHSLGDRGGAEVRRNVANALAQAEQRDAIQHLGLAVRREGRDQALHGLRVCRVPRGLRAVAVEHFDGVEVLLLAERGRLGPPRLRRGAKPLEHGPGGGAVLFVPDRVRVRERLAPVGQGESRVDPLRLAERLGRVPILEAVQQQDATDERCLRRGGARRREVDRPEMRRLGRHPRGRGDARQRHQTQQRTSHAHESTTQGRREVGYRLRAAPFDRRTARATSG